MKINRFYIYRLVGDELERDIGVGDITTTSIVPPYLQTTGQIISRSCGILAGIEFAKATFAIVDNSVNLDTHINDGEKLTTGDVIVRVSGSAHSILKAERTALNFLGHLSGIATQTANFVKAVEGTGTVILDTRKTIPGLRLAEKYAVKCGGGENHRMGLYDMILIKDNHITAVGGITQTLTLLYSKGKPNVPVEIEVSNLRELEQALRSPVDRIMLDNFTLEMTQQAVKLRKEKNSEISFESSGGINIDTVRDYAEIGVEFISIGAIIHSAPQFDLSLELEMK